MSIEEPRPRGGPRVYPSKYTWQVTENGLELIEVRKSQFGDYRKFKSTNKGVSYFGTVDTPLFDSIEEANQNRPEVMETKLREKKKAGGPRKYPSKFGYIVNADNKLELKELRFFEASGQRKSGYRVSDFYPSGQIKQGKMYQGQIFDSVEEAENSYKEFKSITDPLDDYDGPPYDAQTMDRDVPNYDEYYDPGPRPTPGNIVMGPDGPYEETVQDAADWDYEQELLREEADAEDRRLDMQAEEERLRAAGDLEYGNPDLDNPLDDFDGPAYDAQTMDADTPIDTSSRNSRFPMRPESIDPNISNSLAKNMNVEPSVMKRILGVGMKLLPFIDEEILIAGPATLASKALRAGGFVKTAAGVTAGAGAIAAYETYWMIANLGMAALNQIRSEAKEPGGVPEMLFSEDVSTDNKEQFFNDLDRYLKGSIAMNVWKYGISRPMGYDDPIDVIKRMVGK